MLTIKNIKKSGHFAVISDRGTLVGTGRAHQSKTDPTMVTLIFSRAIVERLNAGHTIRVPADWTSEITYEEA